jgi:hypothetical protein
VDCKSAYAGSIPTSASTLKSPAAIRLRGFFVPADFVPAVNWDNPGTLRSFNGGTVLAAHWSLAKTSACSPLSSAVAGVNPPSYACHSATSFPCGPMCSLPMTEMAISVLCFRDRRTEMEFHAAWLRGMIGERKYELLNLDK